MSVTGHHLCNILAWVDRVNLKQYLLLNCLTSDFDDLC